MVFGLRTLGKTGFPESLQIGKIADLNKNWNLETLK